MKHPHFAEQKNRNAAPLTLTDFGAEFNEESFDLTPWDMPTDRVSEDGLKGALVPSLHRWIVPLSGT